MPFERVCEIVFAGVGTSGQDLLPIVDCDDGAYDLHDLVGSPDEVGKAIADSLRETDMMHGQRFIMDHPGAELFITIKIKVSNKGE